MDLGVEVPKPSLLRLHERPRGDLVQGDSPKD